MRTEILYQPLKKEYFVSARLYGEYTEYGNFTLDTAHPDDELMLDILYKLFPDRDIIRLDDVAEFTVKDFK